MSGQDFSQGEVYYSERTQRNEEIKTMPIPYAERVLGKLVRLEGEQVRNTALGQALTARIEQGQEGNAVTTEVLAIGGGRMLRGRRGRFTGAYKQTRPKPSVRRPL